MLNQPMSPPMMNTMFGLFPASWRLATTFELWLFTAANSAALSAPSQHPPLVAHTTG
jgi:hypothetical protein